MQLTLAKKDPQRVQGHDRAVQYLQNDGKELVVVHEQEGLPMQVRSPCIGRKRHVNVQSDSETP